MKNRFSTAKAFSLATALVFGVALDFSLPAQPVRAESEASSEAPQTVGYGRRRRGRRGYGNMAWQRQQQQEQRKLQQSEAQTRKVDQQDANRRARALARLKEKDVIHEYGPGAKSH